MIERSRSGVVGAESVLQPVAAWRRRAGIDDANDIETHRAMRVSGMPGEKLRGGAYYPALLVAVHGMCGCQKTGGAAAPYLDKNHAVGIAHDQVQLAATRVEVPGKQFEPAAPQQTERPRFGKFA